VNHPHVNRPPDDPHDDPPPPPVLVEPDFETNPLSSLDTSSLLHFGHAGGFAPKDENFSNSFPH